jgi:pSer/pThr/pTyr-binding forkhead associated (FHA) protein
MSSMKLVFPGGEHPQVMLDPGISRIGSDPHANIVLDQPGVLPQHCQLHVTAAGVMLEVPHDTTVGVNGQRVDGLIALRPGDSVTFDHVLARLASLETVGQAREASDSGVNRAANDDPGATLVRQVMPMYVLRGLTGGTFGRSYALHGPLTIGRAPDCDICVGDGGLSRLHARLVPRDDGVLIEDLDSTNGSFVNDRRVRRHKACIGDEIGFDKVRFRLAGSGACAPDHSGPAQPMSGSQAPGQYAQWARATTIGALLLALAAVAALAAQYYL